MLAIKKHPQKATQIVLQSLAFMTTLSYEKSSSIKGTNKNFVRQN